MIDYYTFHSEFTTEKGKKSPRNVREGMIRALARYIVRSGNLEFDIDTLTEIEDTYSKVGNKFNLEVLTRMLDLAGKNIRARKRLFTLIRKDMDLIQEIIR